VTRRFSLEDPAATAALAEQIVRALPGDLAGWTLLLRGDLGTGKSTLARAMLHAMGHEGPVPSPTYTLVEPYEIPGCTVYHIDLYRIINLEELEYLGWQDLRDGMIILEWPERAPELLGQADLLIDLEYEGDGRTACLSALSSRAGPVIDRVSATECAALD